MGKSPQARSGKAAVRMNMSKSKHDKQLSRQQSRKSSMLDESTMETLPTAPTPPSTSFAALAASAANQSSSYEENGGEVDDAAQQTSKDYSHRAYMRELKRVMDLSDVILMVLDARDPQSCRSATIEREIRRREGEGKKLVFVLNKIDLVPKENVEAWLQFLRVQYPTVAFKASTQQQRTNLSQKRGGGGSSGASSSDCYGADGLVNLLKNYTRNANLKTSIVCGIIGFPNVGKSSVVNSLKRSKACGVGATPGFTKVAQEVVLDKNIKILDSPGVVFADDDSQEAAQDQQNVRRRQAETTLRNVVKVENVDDVQPSIELILERCTPTHLMQLYEIPEYNSVTDFLVKIALLRGRLGKGGVPDLVGAGRQVLRDYTTGRIPYYTQPPRTSMGAPTIKSKQSTLSSGFYPREQRSEADLSAAAAGNGNGDGNGGDAAIVSEFGQAFDLAGLLGESDAQALSGAGTASFDTLKRGREDSDVNVDADNEHAMGDGMATDTAIDNNAAPGIVSLPPKKKTKQATALDSDQHARLFNTAETQQFANTNPFSRQAQKKLRKAEAKARAKSGALPMSGPGGEGELMKALNGLDVKMDVGGEGEAMQDSDGDDTSEEDQDEGYDGGRSGYGMSMFNVAPAPAPAPAQAYAPPTHAPQMIDEDEEL
ncbi:hypothetical protein E3P99_02582 [Wallemia hederae]|uniref:CP-type G domain-containing protein n=1 Tax=Wallemia hederae TaxID=1540922 RepID=A0A4T0FJS4_9BASI|nr:hypothetical protein E3P99_02582 [Wallemia hederae]